MVATFTKISYVILHVKNMWNWDILTYEIFISHMKINFTYEIFISNMELKYFHIWCTLFTCEMTYDIFDR